MALPPNFLDELRVRTPLSAVIGRRVRLARSGRQLKGCCPFHGEKTPSFYVYDDHFHCFGCGAHGDAIGFVMQSQGLGFMEAVEQLAAEAGLEVPKPTPEAAEAERRRLDLGAVLDLALAHYQRRLLLPEGRQALDYLRGRGLTEETIRQFGLGWSGEIRGGLLAEFAREGVETHLSIESGLIRRDDATERVFELFSNRVMFPIRDRRGRTISFGGRIMGDGQPKYVNGPETSLFSKGHNLYALDLAQAAVRNGERLVVVEGYMDVIALHQAGFTASVAPLGTALTADQLALLWRLSPAPILCFDGDAAGGRAAARAAELALPTLAPDRSLSLARLPAGEDPDSMVRRQGPAAFRGVLDAAQPLADALYDLLRRDGTAATPEQRAAFRTRLEEAARRIPDKSLASEYRRALLDRFFAERSNGAARGDRFRGGFGKGAFGQGSVGHGEFRPGAFGQRSGAPSSVPGVVRPTPDIGGVATERKRILLAILLGHPDLLHDVEHAFAELDLDPGLSRLRDVILSYSDGAEVLDSGTLMDHLTQSGLADEVARIMAAVPVPLPAFAGPAAMPAEAEAGWWHIFGFLHLDRLRQEVAAAEAETARDMTTTNQNRQKTLVEALNKVLAGEPDVVDLVAA